MSGNPARAALLDLALKFDKAAADADQNSPTYKGYRLAMQHAAERARQAAADHPLSLGEWPAARLCDNGDCDHFIGEPQ